MLKGSPEGCLRQQMRSTLDAECGSLKQAIAMSPGPQAGPFLVLAPAALSGAGRRPRNVVPPR